MADFNQQIIDEFRANGGHAPSYPWALEHPNALVLLHHTGAKSGAERVNPLVALLRDDDIVVFASYAGAPQNPAWFHNLMANPETTVELGTETIAVKARVAEGAEHDELWERQKQLQPGFAEYEAKTDRTIPVVILERA